MISSEIPFDFLDVGCSSGGSLAWGAKVLGGRGLGIDTDPTKVQNARAAGRDAVLADAANLNFPDGTFRYVLFFDMLEHLPNAELAQQCVREAYRVSREFVLIRGPNFDGEAHLRERGLKRYYADWSGHAWHHRAADFLRIIRSIGPANSLVLAHDQMKSSVDPDLLPIQAPSNQGRYDPDRHGPKPLVQLTAKLFSRLVVVLAKSKEIDVNKLALVATGAFLYLPDGDS